MAAARTVLLLTLALAASAAAAAIPVPPLGGPVVDRAGVVDPESVQRLEAVARSAWRSGAGPQLQFLVVRSLEGEPIEDFSMRVVEAWRLGARERDDGILVTVAVEDRRARIEVGGGVEGSLTDARSAQIIRDVLAPAFRERRYGPGLVAAAEEILSALGSPSRAAPRVPGVAPQALGDRPSIPLLPSLVFLAVLFGAPLGILAIVVLMIVAIVTGRRRTGTGASWSYDSSSSSSHFSSSSSGGGWSGGGGSFSGGGASGSW